MIQSRYKGHHLETKKKLNEKIILTSSGIFISLRSFPAKFEEIRACGSGVIAFQAAKQT